MKEIMAGEIIYHKNANLTEDITKSQKFFTIGQCLCLFITLS